MENRALHFTLKALPPNEVEQKLFGIFISHSSADGRRLDELAKKMSLPEHKLNPIFDREFLKGGDYFHKKIKQCINCYAGVVIISKKALRSDWVSYECGYFAGLGMPVVLWDPDNVLSLRSVDNDLLNVHLSQYLPAVRTSDEVVRRLKTMSVYSGIFKNECRDFKRADFDRMLAERVSTVMVRLSSDMLNEKKELFRECKLGTLVVNFGMFYEKQSDGEHCWAKRLMQADGSYSLDEAPVLKGRACPVSGQKCAMYSTREVQPDKRECIILNHVMHNGRYFAAGESYHDGTPVKEGTLSFYVPVHKVYGTEFKFIVDAPDNQRHHELLRLFERMGLNPSVSDSMNGWRIYLSIPEVPTHGFFKLKHDYDNNFLCPRATVEEDKRY